MTGPGVDDGEEEKDTAEDEEGGNEMTDSRGLTGEHRVLVDGGGSRAETGSPVVEPETPESDAGEPTTTEPAGDAQPAAGEPAATAVWLLENAKLKEYVGELRKLKEFLELRIAGQNDRLRELELSTERAKRLSEQNLRFRELAQQETCDARMDFRLTKEKLEETERRLSNTQQTLIETLRTQHNSLVRERGTADGDADVTIPKSHLDALTAGLKNATGRPSHDHGIREMFGLDHGAGGFPPLSHVLHSTQCADPNCPLRAFDDQHHSRATEETELDGPSHDAQRAETTRHHQKGDGS